VINSPEIQYPLIIQGGMGIGVSTAEMARSVAISGHLGVVSGTALDAVITRKLQDGDADGRVREALSLFPDQNCVEELLSRYFIEGGKDLSASYLDIPKPSMHPSTFASQLLVMSSFVEVATSKAGHDGLIGINLLEKIQLVTPASLYGAMLAGVDYILMGAGIPTEIPGLIKNLSLSKYIRFPIRVTGGQVHGILEFDPKIISHVNPETVSKPLFLAIVSSHILASYLYRDEATRPDGFIVEGPMAGGHNAPPRAKDSIDADGQSIFTSKDFADIPAVAALNLPFWLAGGFGTPQRVGLAMELGATGVQVGSLFALAEESGLTTELKDHLLSKIISGTIEIRTEPHYSSTGFPIKVVNLAGTATDTELFDARQRQCDLGYLRTPYQRDSGSIGFRCSAEPIKIFAFKGGDTREAQGVRCLCNALLANIGLGQVRWGSYHEPALITMGSDVSGCLQMWRIKGRRWSSQEVIEYLLSELR
jgi:NAD(P)H-dependent flavin oxidoreductase YrpB (nitropropane dioxygenase family)